jgi:hypothetical protein
MLEISKSNPNIGTTFSSVDPNIYSEFIKNKDAEIFEKVVFDLMLNKYSDDPELSEYILSLPNDKKRMALLSLIDGDNVLWSKMNSYVNECSDKFEHIKDVIKIMAKFVKDGEVERKKFGEVMTPISLVREMLDTLPKEVWSNPNLKWLDPANGAGTFPYVVIYKLMNGLSEWEPDVELRYKHIVENMVYTCELQSRNVFLWLCGVDPKDEYTTNSYWGSFLDEGFDYHMKNVWGIEKFDIIIGNPPYQEMDGGNGPSARPIYNNFTEKSILISNTILFITPSRWFAGGKGLDSFRRMMMNSNKIVLINHFDDATKIFGNSVEIKGGVSYFIYDKNHNANTNINGSSIDLKKFDIIVKEIESFSILSKISNFDSISDLCKGRGDNTFDIQTNDKRLSDVCLEEHIKVYVSKQKGFVKWVDIKNVKKHEDMYSYKLYTTEAAGSTGNLGKFGNMFIGEQNSICSGSYIWFPLNSINECENLKSYLQTNFAQYLLSLRKITHHIKPDTLKWIPLVPLDREWNDEMLFQYFNLDQNEISIIKNKK